MKSEILAPAGNEEALRAAFAAGADAVYFALQNFGARAFAKNFTLEQTGRLIEEAHLAGKKIYITMNTIIEEDQMEEAYEQALALHKLGVDALILQDLGLIHLLHHRLPNLELHASTQLSTLTPFSIRQLARLGISRVVLAREATLEEIRACAATGMELEVFVHGALCISYSGQCQFSQVRYGRSGNKGACAQPCRMEYTLLENEKPVKTQGNFLLSSKDLSVIQDVNQLLEAGAYSLKIEGRMKSPSYVYSSVRALRKRLENKKLTDQDLRDLKTAFNRGYTKGHAFDQRGIQLMNPVASNHQGIPLGKVLSVYKDKARIALCEDLHQNDGIRFLNDRSSFGQVANFLYDPQGKLISSARAGDVVEIRLNGRTFPQARVVKTTSFIQNKAVEHEMVQTTPQIGLSILLEAENYNDPLVLKVGDGHRTIIVTGPELQQAKKVPTSQAAIEKPLQATGKDWAKVEQIQIDLPDAPFVPAQVLKSMRREAMDKLEEKRKEKKPVIENPYSLQLASPDPLFSFVEVLRLEQCLEDGLEQVSEFPLPGTVRKAGLHDEKGIFCTHLSQGNIVEGMNITNSYALAALLELGYQGAVLSGELSDTGLKQLLEAFQNRYGFEAPVIFTVYEKPRLMVMKHCPVNTALKDGKRQHCSLCRTSRYVLEGKDGARASLYGNPQCEMQIFDEHPVDQMDRIGELSSLGISAFRMVLSDENKEEAGAIRNRFFRKLDEQNNRSLK